MIKLKKEIYDEYKDEYIKHCLKNFVYIPDQTKLFNGKITRNKLFCVKDENNEFKFNEEKFKKILLMNFDDLSKNDEILNNYFKTGLLISRSNFEVDIELTKINKECNDENKIQFIKDYINKYRNEWINDYFPEDDDEIYKNTDNFKKIVDKIQKEYNDLTLISINEKDKEKHIIEYSTISREFRNKLLNSTNISVCPYCNRQFISSFHEHNEKKEIRATATIDHFYPKSKFPLFSLSLYNFIPACHICNETLKNTSTKQIMYPFKKGYQDQAHFKLKSYESIESLLGLDDQFKIYVDVENKNENSDIINSVELFRTEEIYNYHKDYVKSILFKSTIYSDKYKDFLKDLFKNLGLNYSDEELKAFLYDLDFNDPEQTNVILGRLTKDILEQIEQLKKNF